MTLATVKHRSASGDLASLWEYDPLQRRVFVTVRLGSAAPVSFDALVCSERDMRHGAYILGRLSGDTFALTPALCLDEDGAVVARASKFCDDLPVVGSITLTAAPEHVSLELAALWP